MVVIILLTTMKLGTLTAAFSVLLAATVQGSGDSVINISTSLGRVYQNCRVCQVDPDGVIFAHQSGIAKVLYGELPESIRGKLGYDAQKSAEYVKEQSEKKRRAQELAAELQKELIKARAAVTVAEIQSAGMVQQAYAMGGGWQYPVYTGGLYGWDGSLYNNGHGGAFDDQHHGWRNIWPGNSGLNFNHRVIGGPGSSIRCNPGNNLFTVPPLKTATPPLSINKINLSPARSHH